MKKLITICAAVTMILAVSSMAQAALLFDQNVTPNVIFGSGNANGGFTVDTAGGVELGLRGKLRHDATGQPQNIFNSNGDGTYTFQAGVAPTQSFPTAEWSFEWSINSNVDGTGGFLNAYRYELGMDSDPTAGVAYTVILNPINNPAYIDHAYGNNATAPGAGTVGNPGNFLTLSGTNNVAQNSSKAHWLIIPFDPTVTGTYNIYLAAFDQAGAQVARTDIAVNVVPEPATMGLLSLGALVLRRKRK